MTTEQKYRLQPGIYTKDEYDFTPHSGPADCPTWYDHCNCTPATCVQLWDLLDKEESRTAELQKKFDDLSKTFDTQMRKAQKTISNLQKFITDIQKAKEAPVSDDE